MAASAFMGGCGRGSRGGVSGARKGGRAKRPASSDEPVGWNGRIKFDGGARRKAGLDRSVIGFFDLWKRTFDERRVLPDSRLKTDLDPATAQSFCDLGTYYVVKWVKLSLFMDGR